MHKRLVLLLGLLLALGSLTLATGPSQAATSSVTVRLRYAIRHLPVAAHSHVASYERSKDFGGWITQYGECDTRAVVLKQESLKPTTQNSYCTVKTGKWFSFYNARYYYSAYGGTVQIDHVVPVENAWVSGAWAWTKATRVRFYNDLGDSRTLVAVDRADNEAKGDSDPTRWLPSHGRCQYIRYWTAVKIRWHLHVTGAEKAKLSSLAQGCPNTFLSVRKASISYR